MTTLKPLRLGKTCDNDRNIQIWRDLLRGVHSLVLAKQHGVTRTRIYMIRHTISCAIRRALNDNLGAHAARQALEGVTITVEAGCGDVRLRLDGGREHVLRNALHRAPLKHRRLIHD